MTVFKPELYANTNGNALIETWPQTGEVVLAVTADGTAYSSVSLTGNDIDKLVLGLLQAKAELTSKED